MMFVSTHSTSFTIRRALIYTVFIDTFVAQKILLFKSFEVLLGYYLYPADTVVDNIVVALISAQSLLLDGFIFLSLSIQSFAQWRYPNQWGLFEVRLLLVEKLKLQTWTDVQLGHCCLVWQWWFIVWLHLLSPFRRFLAIFFLHVKTR